MNKRQSSQGTQPLSENVATIIAESARFFDVDEDMISGRSRKKEVVKARGMIVYLLRRLLGFSFSETANVLGRDLATAMYLDGMFENLLEDDGDLKPELDRVVAGLDALADGPHPLGRSMLARRLIERNPSLPIAICAHHSGEGSCQVVDHAEVAEILNRRTTWFGKTVCDSREKLVDAIELDIQCFGFVDGYSEDWDDEEIRHAAEKEAEKYAGDWVPAIVLHTG